MSSSHVTLTHLDVPSTPSVPLDCALKKEDAAAGASQTGTEDGTLGETAQLEGVTIDEVESTVRQGYSILSQLCRTCY